MRLPMRLIFERQSYEIDMCQKILTGQLSTHIVNVANFSLLQNLIEMSIRQTFWQPDSCLEIRSNSRKDWKDRKEPKKPHWKCHFEEVTAWPTLRIRGVDSLSSKHSHMPQFDPVSGTIRTHDSRQLQFWMSQLPGLLWGIREIYAHNMRNLL